MILLTGNSRYDTPAQGLAYKLSPGELVKVVLADFYKGYIRVGKRAYSCAFLKTVSGGDLAPGNWIYCPKGRFMDLVHFVLLHGDVNTTFYVEYHDSKPYGTLDWFLESDIPKRKEIRSTVNQMLYGRQAASA